MLNVIGEPTTSFDQSILIRHCCLEKKTLQQCEESRITTDHNELYGTAHAVVGLTVERRRSNSNEDPSLLGMSSNSPTTLKTTYLLKINKLV